MNRYANPFLLFLTVFIISSCSVFGNSDVEIAPYTVLEKEDAFELRHYESMVLVSTDMSGLDNQNSPFGKLFNYISGKNEAAQEIPMTAPVFMDQSDTASETMAFVLPTSLSLETAPQPQDPTVQLEEITDYTVATITFSGFLKQDNIQKHKAMLEDWIERKNLKITGQVKAAGYNPPFTIPALRRNEVLIPVEKP
ncbi:MAG: heme-binding protein [Pseudomonadota bacterium]